MEMPFRRFPVIVLLCECVSVPWCEHAPLQNRDMPWEPPLRDCVPGRYEIYEKVGQGQF